MQRTAYSARGSAGMPSVTAPTGAGDPERAGDSQV